MSNPAVFLDKDGTLIEDVPYNVNPERIVEAIENHGVTNMFASPALLERVGAYGRSRGITFPSLKRVISAGAPVQARTIELIAAGTGALTLLVAGLIALVQTDIKRVIAYSTMSQIGYMFLAAGLGAYSNSMFHLMTHAFFKALLFLAAGILIHALAGEQDLRRMGGLKDELPLTYWTFLIGAIAILLCFGVLQGGSGDYAFDAMRAAIATYAGQHCGVRLYFRF